VQPIKYNQTMFLLIDKPKGMTSHDVIDSVRKITGERKVGHAGTLDPNATGLLIVAIGREATKKLGRIAKDTKKTYVAEIFLGEERETDDAEGKILKQVQNDKGFTKKIIKEILKSFEGKQEQIPPLYSAIKIKGRKAYELARKGKKVRLEPRKIMIHSIKLIDYKYPRLKIEVNVSAGTYIRALARDIGRKLGCGAYLKNLKRIRIGRFDIKNAVKLSKLENFWQEKNQADNNCQNCRQEDGGR
jgi:tRNA pseudouridine55 synthase